MDTKRLIHLLGFAGAVAAAIVGHAELFSPEISKWAEFVGSVAALALAWAAKQPGTTPPDSFVKPR